MFFYIGWFVVSLCLIFFAENYLITTDDIIQQNNINVIIAFKKVFYIAFDTKFNCWFKRLFYWN